MSKSTPSKQQAKNGNSWRAAKEARKIAENQRPSIRADRQLNAVYKPGNPLLKDALVVVIGGEHGFRQFTIHRPIGVTTLDKEEEWVLTESDEIPSLIAHKDDPRVPKVLQLRKEAVEIQAGEVLKKTYPKYVEIVENEIYYCGEARKAIIKNATKKAQADKKLLASKAKTEDKEKSPDLSVSRIEREKYMHSVHVFLDGKLRELKTPELSRAVEVKHPLPKGYFTGSGPSGDIPQKALACAKGLTKLSVQEQIVKILREIPKDSKEKDPIHLPEKKDEKKPPEPVKFNQQSLAEAAKLLGLETKSEEKKAESGGGSLEDAEKELEKLNPTHEPDKEKPDPDPKPHHKGGRPKGKS